MKLQLKLPPEIWYYIIEFGMKFGMKFQDFQNLKICNKMFYSLINNNNEKISRYLYPNQGFSCEQIYIIETLRQGNNIMLLAQAGTGKSKIISSLQEIFPNKRISVTASTGVASFNINGSTIHSYLGIGIGNDSIDDIYTKIRKRKDVIKRIREIDLLVIDEISMISAELFDNIIEPILRKIRGTKKFAGGIQLLCSGDLFQLECITGKMINKSKYFNKFKHLTLHKNFRQEKDPIFAGILTRIRKGKITKKDRKILESRKTTEPKDDIVHLFLTNEQVVRYNKKKSLLVSDAAEQYTFTAVILKGLLTPIRCLLLDELLKQFRSRDLLNVTLKVGYRVMLLRNLNVQNGIVNGAIGTIVGFNNCNELPVVKFDVYPNEIEIPKCKWNTLTETSLYNSSVTQIPLMICYSSTIHKCQGLTLKSAKIDILNCFKPNQIYVALSRVQTLDGLFLY